MSLQKLDSTRNLVINPSWETTTTGWSLTQDTGIAAVYSRANDASWSGSFSGKVAVSTNTAVSTKETRLKTGSINVLEGENYVFTVRTQTTNSNFAPRCRIEWYDSGAVLLLTTNEAINSSQSIIGFTKHTLDATAPVGAVTAVVIITGYMVVSNLANVSMWADGAQFEQNDVATSYCDGDQPDCFWDGTAHQSTSRRDATFVRRGTIGRHGVIKLQPKLFIATKDNILRENITDWIVNGQVKLDTESDVQMTFDADILFPDALVPFVDFLAPFLEVIYADGTFVEEQVGLFTVIPPSKTYTFIDTHGQVNGRDMTWLVSQQGFGNTYRIGTNVTIVPLVRSLIEGCGFSRHAIQDSPRQTGKERSYPPGTSKLQIINELLKAISYNPLYTDRRGKFRSMPFVNINKSEPVGIYVGGDDGVVIEPFEMSPNLDKLANHIIVFKEDTKDDPGSQIKAERRNTNPASPTSIPNIGEIVKVVRESSLADQQAADDLADKNMREWSNVYINATLKTFPEPWHEPYEVYELHLTDRHGVVIPEADGRFLCKGWELGFTPKDATMTHNIWRIVKYGSDEA